MDAALPDVERGLEEGGAARGAAAAVQPRQPAVRPAGPGQHLPQHRGRQPAQPRQVQPGRERRLFRLGDNTREILADLYSRTLEQAGAARW